MKKFPNAKVTKDRGYREKDDKVLKELRAMYEPRLIALRNASRITERDLMLRITPAISSF